MKRRRKEREREMKITGKDERLKLGIGEQVTVETVHLFRMVYLILRMRRSAEMIEEIDLREVWRFLRV